MMLLNWRKPDPPIVTRWRGPDGRLAVSALSLGATTLPTLIGPPGPQGPPGPSIDFETAIFDGGTFA